MGLERSEECLESGEGFVPVRASESASVRSERNTAAKRRFREKVKRGESETRGKKREKREREAAGALELKRMHEAVVASSTRGPNPSKRYAPTSGPKMNAILAIATHRPISRSPPPARLRRASNSGCTCSNVPTHKWRLNK